MDVFELRNRLVQDYADYVRSFINIRDARIAETVEQKLAEGVLWPEPLIQLNPFFEPGGSIGDLVGNEQLLHSECERIFAIKDENTGDPGLLLEQCHFLPKLVVLGLETHAGDSGICRPTASMRHRISGQCDHMQQGRPDASRPTPRQGDRLRVPVLGHFASPPRLQPS